MKARLYLGAPDLWRYRDSRLESALDGLDADAEAEVVALLDAIAEADGLLAADGSAIQSAGLKRAEDIEWYGDGKSVTGESSPMQAAAARGRQLINRLSIILGVPIINDYFGRRGYGGDEFMGFGFQYGGGIMRLG